MSRHFHKTATITAALFFFAGLALPHFAEQEQDARRAENANEVRLNRLQPPDQVMDAIGIKPGMVIAPIVLGVVGNGEEFDAIERSTRDARVRDHPIEVERISSSPQAASCHLLFVTASRADRAGEMIRATRGGGVLTVGDREEFTRIGGIINFFTRGDRIRFAINRGAAEAAGLKLSAQLLRLGKIVSTENEVSAPAGLAAPPPGR